MLVPNRLRSTRLRTRLPPRLLLLLLITLLIFFSLYTLSSRRINRSSSTHLLISLASSSLSLPTRLPFLRLSLSSTTTTTHALLFLDKPLPHLSSLSSSSLLRVLVSDAAAASRFPYSFPRGSRSAVRVARIVKEAVLLDLPDVRWYVFGDDDTVFFVENLVRVLGKYDYNGMYYVGSGSESYQQGVVYSFDMAFGGGGFAISKGLARVLATVLDDCLMRYPHLYGSDARVYSCVAELGVGLTLEPGFHQVDVRGDIFGILSAHPKSPLLSLHHLEQVDPIFPNMTRVQALTHLFKAYNVDPARILQQTVCYLSNSLTVSLSWGYSVQVFEGNYLLPDLLKMQRTFRPWRRKRDVYSNMYTLNTRELDNDTCKRPVVFFLDSVGSGSDKIWTDYTRHFVGNCWRTAGLQSLEHIRVFSQKLDYDLNEVLYSLLVGSIMQKVQLVNVFTSKNDKASRRQCCDVSSSFGRSMIINVRRCGVDELISMKT